MRPAPTPGARAAMRAIVQDRYGPPDVLRLAEVDRPVAGDDELLVRVHAAAVNAHDWHVLRGDPYLARLAFGVGGGPKAKIRGRDFAGRVESVGRDVTRFRPGDEVYGDLGEADGAFAEYVSVRADLVEPKPANLTFEQAAAMPVAGSTALICLRDAARLQPGQHVLVNGASGGVGTFAVQIARSLGAEVTGVCSTRNLELVRGLGAEQVIDYTREDFTRTGRHHPQPPQSGRAAQARRVRAGHAGPRPALSARRDRGGDPVRRGRARPGEGDHRDVTGR